MAQADADALKSAFKGIGCDKKKVIETDAAIKKT